MNMWFVGAKKQNEETCFSGLQSFPAKLCQQTLSLQLNKTLLSCLIRLNQGNKAKNLALRC